eukprot:7380499-Alexandrium_andersonii.AAC.1
MSGCACAWVGCAAAPANPPGPGATSFLPACASPPWRGALQSPGGASLPPAAPLGRPDERRPLSS